MLKIIEGDLFTTDAKYLIHQCNCVTTKAAHLAYNVFKNYPWADVYSCRDPEIQKLAIENNESSEANFEYYKDKPGDIIIRGDGKDQRYVIALLGQFYPGKPRYPNSKLDGFEARQEYFFQALKKVAEMKNLQSVAIPYGIGCGAAGGNWDVYYQIIKNFADFVDADVLLYRYKK